MHCFTTLILKHCFALKKNYKVEFNIFLLHNFFSIFYNIQLWKRKYNVSLADLLETMNYRIIYSSLNKCTASLTRFCLDLNMYDIRVYSIYHIFNSLDKTIVHFFSYHDKTYNVDIWKANPHFMILTIFHLNLFLLLN